MFAFDTITASTTSKLLFPAQPTLRICVTGLTIAHATLAGVTDFLVRTVPVAAASQTLAANRLVMPADYGWDVGDLIHVTASTVTGLTAGAYYYLFSNSGGTLSFTAARGGAIATISGTAVTATLAKVLFRSGLSATALPIQAMTFVNHLFGGTGQGIEAVTVTSRTGQIDFNVQGYMI